MKPARWFVPVALTFISVAAVAQTQSATDSTADEKATSIEKPPVVIISQKIGVDYYPMLDRPSLTTPAMTAENGDLPMTENERIARLRNRNSSNKLPAAPIAPEETRSRGRLRSYTRIIDEAQMVQFVIKNTGQKPIKIVEWDFAYPRYEEGKLLSRYVVTTKTEIKPGGKKTLKHRLAAGAKKCEVVRVISDENQPEKVSTFEAVCGQGFHDPSLFRQKEETISIKRIEYSDGSIWQRND